MSSSPATARIACASPPFVERATATEIDDWLAYFDPDLVMLTGESAAPRTASVLRRHLEAGTAFFQPTGNSPASGPRTVEGIQFVFAPTTETLEEIAEYEGTELATDEPTYVLSGLLELEVDTTALSTSLVGREEYRRHLEPERLAGEYVHVSSRLPAEYRRDWGELAVVGGGAEAGSAGTPLVALDCRADGQVLTRTLRPARLGLRALEDVGRTRARRLRNAGFADRDAVVDADPSALADVRGLGRTTAVRIQRSARAVARGEVIRESDEPLPRGDPVYVDIETDGLTPTITWLIGTLDGSSDGEYVSFLATDPDEPGRAIEEFMAWYTANASGRPLVAYNGWNFDFDVLHDHIIEHRPGYEDDWTDTYRFDPYRWAVEEGNAVLPGRTNTLEDVASALGYERTEAGLTGAAVARAYREWTADRSPATEPDWERFDAYCEDDVRALATVYEALAASGRIVSNDGPSRDVRETTTQGSLSDW